MEHIEKNVVNPVLLRKYDEEEFERQKKIFQELKGVLDDLSEYCYAMVKGQVLSQIAYGKPGYRKSHDVDLLVDKKDLLLIDNIFIKHGFSNMVCDDNGNYRLLTRREKIMYINSHQTAPYIKWINKENLKIEVDINISAFGSEMKKNENIDAAFLHDIVDMTIFGQKIKILSNVKAFIHLSLHHYREMNAPYIFKLCNPINTRMFEDIYRFYIQEIEGKIDELYEVSSSFDTNKYLYYMLYYTNRVFKDKRLENAVEVFRSEEGEKLLDCYGLTISEQKKWLISFEERLDADDLYGFIVRELNTKERDKIDTIWSIKN